MRVLILGANRMIGHPLLRLATDDQLCAMSVQAGQAALDQELSLRTFLDRFAQLIGISPADLLPIDDDRFR